MKERRRQYEACRPCLLRYCGSISNHLIAQVERTWNSRGGTMGDRVVNTSLIAPATSSTQPTTSSEIVDAEDPEEDFDVGRRF
jgi:hypothetical protein